MFILSMFSNLNCCFFLSDSVKTLFSHCVPMTHLSDLTGESRLFGTSADKRHVRDHQVPLGGRHKSDAEPGEQSFRLVLVSVVSSLGFNSLWSESQ